MHIIYEIIQKKRIQRSIKIFFFMTAIILISYINNAIAKQFTYLGVDFGSERVCFQPSFGQDLFNNQSIPQYNIFVGHSFTSLLGFELGYTKSVTKRTNVFVPAMTSQFGLRFFTGVASNVYDAFRSMQGININYVPHLPITKDLKLIFIIGANYSRIKACLNLTQFDGTDATSMQQENFNVVFSSAEFAPRFGLRLQYTVRSLGVRVGYVWEQTAKFALQTTRAINQAQTLTAKLKNSSAFSVGVFYKF